jgi:hypothetical protein
MRVRSILLERLEARWGYSDLSLDCSDAECVLSSLTQPQDVADPAGLRHELGERKPLAERCDLLHAFDEIAPSIEILVPEEVNREIIVIAAGATLGGPFLTGGSLRKQTARCSKSYQSSATYPVKSVPRN